MTLRSVAIRGLRHHWRTNAAAAAGVAIAVAVLAGAYNVGESVRASLRDLALARFGETQYAVTSNTSFRETLLPECPLIALEAVVTHDDRGRRASRVALYAVDQRFWQFHQRAVQPPDRNEFLLSDALAAELGAKANDKFSFACRRRPRFRPSRCTGAKTIPGALFGAGCGNDLARRNGGVLPAAAAGTGTRRFCQSAAVPA